MNDGRTEARLDCVYRRSWQDGFGARGWKLAIAEADPEVIASSAATGDRIPTSVFVHDVLDHALCGLGSSGHRNEAIALLQLAARTGADPTPDFAQMVEEDLLCGRAVGEGLRELLPHDLMAYVPATCRCDQDIVRCLVKRFGREAVRMRLIARFFELGEAGSGAAAVHYTNLGLDYRQRAAVGLNLQGLLEEADALAKQSDWSRAEGSVLITNRRCTFRITTPEHWLSQAEH